MRGYVRILPLKVGKLRTFALLTDDLGAGGPGFKSRRPDWMDTGTDTLPWKAAWATPANVASNHLVPEGRPPCRISLQPVPWAANGGNVPAGSST